MLTYFRSNTGAPAIFLRKLGTNPKLSGGASAERSTAGIPLISASIRDARYTMRSNTARTARALASSTARKTRHAARAGTNTGAAHSYFTPWLNGNIPLSSARAGPVVLIVHREVIWRHLLYFRILPLAHFAYRTSSTTSRSRGRSIVA
ncbi:hypothetical protein ACVIGA_007830 [Bradyrhizobium sp. USDA 3240]